MNTDKLATAVLLLNAECRRLDLGELDADQFSALAEDDQAFAMLDDMEARCGMDVTDARALVVEAHNDL